MKSLRKSFHGNKDAHRLQISAPTPLSPSSKPLKASCPPQKVIRAVASSGSQDPPHLPFSKGNFFYVTDDPEDSPWYEAHNPVTGDRGLVPKADFEEVCKSPSPIRVSQAGGGLLSSPVALSPLSPVSPRTPRASVFYAIVLHNFVAERTDELDAKAGDAISVVAHSNREWFVAKPIGRLGRPGLIPASFVEVRDPSTNQIVDVDALIQRGDLPKVEDWKKAMINYKQNSISLGVIEDVGSSVANSPYAIAQSSPVVSAPSKSSPPPSIPPTPLPEGILLSASVVSFHREVHYWFQIHAIFQPYARHHPDQVPKAKRLVLFRQYEDFYDFQVKLLDTFPQEAGREGSGPRILPFMPGQVEEVNDQVTENRREELDTYLRRLCELNLIGATYILEDKLIREFLAPAPGDLDNAIDPQYDAIRIIFPEGESSEAAAVEDDYSIPQGGGEDPHHIPGDRDDRSDASYYGEDRAPPPHAYPSEYQQPDIAPSVHRDGQSLHQYARAALPAHTPTSPDAYYGNGASRGSISSGSQLPDHSPSVSSSVHSSQPSSSRSRSHSKPSVNLNAPPISADNPSPAFLRIKIFAAPSDIYVIRLHPRASLKDLKKKVSEKLGQEVDALFTNSHLELRDDKHLRDWMYSTDKLALWI